MDLALAIRGPMFSLPEKPTTLRLRPDVRAAVEDAAARRGWSVNRFGGWALEQFVSLEFLEKANREFVLEILRQVGPPWDVFHVLNRLLAHARELVRAGRMRPTFWTAQGNSWKKSEVG